MTFPISLSVSNDSKAKGRYRRLDSNNSNLAADSIIQSHKDILWYGKYIEYKSCQINKINVVPITIAFDNRSERTTRGDSVVIYEEKEEVQAE